MPSYEVANVREQGQDMIFIVVNPAFARLPAPERDATISEFQLRATAAKLVGRVVPCWWEIGRWHFFGPEQWRPLFESLGSRDIPAAINGRLHW